MEEERSGKFMELKEAVSRFVQDGSHISLGGSTANRNPMAAVYEIIRQQKKNLYLYGAIMGLGPDLLIGAGCVTAVELGYVGLGRYAPTGPCFKRHVETGRIRYEDYSNFQMALRFLAGSMGIPFIPTKSSLGSDILKRWALDESFRKTDRKISPKKLIIFTNPFDPNGEEELVLLPAINPDVTIIHAQKVDRQGNVRIEGLTFCDVEQAKAAKYLIVTCEEIVEHEVLSTEPQLNHLPSFFPDAVVEVPKGAHPTQCYNYYDLDASFIRELVDASRDDGDLSTFLERFVIYTRDHNEYLGNLRGKVFDEIRADSGVGYKSGLDRRS